jgi:hypothetical protein
MTCDQNPGGAALRFIDRLGLAALLLAVAALPVAGQQPPRVSPAADSVTALIARYDQAWNGRDTATVDRLLAPDYQYFTSTGGVSSRGETLGFLSSPDYQLAHAARSEIQVRVSGLVAVASSRWRGHGRYRGKAFTDDQRCGQVWVRTDVAWLLLTEHCTQIAGASESSE